MKGVAPRRRDNTSLMSIMGVYIDKMCNRRLLDITSVSFNNNYEYDFVRNIEKIKYIPNKTLYLCDCVQQINKISVLNKNEISSIFKEVFEIVKYGDIKQFNSYINKLKIRINNIEQGNKQITLFDKKSIVDQIYNYSPERLILLVDTFYKKLRDINNREKILDRKCETFYSQKHIYTNDLRVFNEKMELNAFPRSTLN